MKHFANAASEYKSDVYAVVCGTNDLKSEQTPKVIAQNVLEIGRQLKTDENKVFISSILKRNDDLDEKGSKVNDYLKVHCCD